MDMDVGAITANASKSALARTSLADNFDTFLTLLTSQLKNQDPLEPMDSGEFTKQLVDFSSVEQAIATNANLEALLGYAAKSEGGTLVSYIGRTVTTTNPAQHVTDQGASWDYTFAADAKTSQITISDASGKPVYTLAGNPAAGTHSFQWDGKDNAGNQLPPGTYSLSVTAVDAGGASLKATIRTSGTVDAIAFSDGKARLVVDGVEVDPDTVETVSL
ncbi:MAG: flagellar hook assembly protein FlgD [Alphaproteobacteria bacterium]|nr:flagellar hook assembly protein FlgD [Alphaproteobacteria bacterium]